MADAGSVYFKVREDGDEVVAIHHGIYLLLFEVQRKFNSSCGINFNQHELIYKVVTKFCKVSKGGGDFCKVANNYRSIKAQTIGFDEDFLLLKPGKKAAIIALELYVAKGLVA